MLNEDLNEQPFDKELILDFFLHFATLECEIKKKGFFKNSEEAAPNWDTFAQAIQGKLQIDSKSVFFTSPPKKQIVKDGTLGWKKQHKDSSESNERYLLRMVCSIRNNLFHGGKYLDGPIEDIARDTKLIKAALFIVKTCLQFVRTFP